MGAWPGRDQKPVPQEALLMAHGEMPGAWTQGAALCEGETRSGGTREGKRAYKFRLLK